MRGLPSSGHVRRSRPARWRGPVRCRCSTERGSRSSSWTTPVAESAEAALRRALPYRVRMGADRADHFRFDLARPPPPHWARCSPISRWTAWTTRSMSDRIAMRQSCTIAGSARPQDDVDPPRWAEPDLPGHRGGFVQNGSACGQPSRAWANGACATAAASRRTAARATTAGRRRGRHTPSSAMGR